MSFELADFSSKFENICSYINSFAFDVASRKCDVSNTNFGEIELCSKIDKKLVCLDTAELRPKNNSIQHDNSAFMSRVESFELGSWTVYNLSPLYCAQYGWKLFSKELLQCVACKAFVCIKLPPLSQYDAYQNFVRLQNQRLQIGHKLWCRWQENPSPYAFCAPPLLMTVSLFKTFANSTDKIAKLGNFLPLLDVQLLLSKLEIIESDILVLFGSTTKVLTESQLIAALLIISGWIYQNDQMIKCNLCLRAVGLWNFFSVNNKDEYQSWKKRCRKRVRRSFHHDEREKKKLRIDGPTGVQVSSPCSVDTEIYDEECFKDEEVERLVKLNSEQQEESKDENPENTMNDRHISTDSMHESSDTITYDPNIDGEIVDGNENKDLSHDVKDEGEQECLDENDIELNGEVKNCEMKADLNRESSNSEVIGNDDSLWSEALGDKVDNVASSESSNDSYKFGDNLPCNVEGLNVSSSSGEPKSNGKDEIRELDVKEQKRIESDDEIAENTKKFESEIDGQKRDSLPDVKCCDATVDSSTIGENQSTVMNDVKIDGKKRKRLDSENEIAENNKKFESEKSDSLQDEKCCNEAVNLDRKRLRDDDETEEPPSKRIIVETLEKSDEEGQDMRTLFDPLGQHRPWCGWVTRHEIKKLSDFYLGDDVAKDIFGYLILPRQLKGLSPLNDTENLVTSSKYSATINGIRSIRNILSGWSLRAEEENLGCEEIHPIEDSEYPDK